MKRKPAKLAPRLGIYLVGLVVLAFGITLAVICTFNNSRSRIYSKLMGRC